MRTDYNQRSWDHTPLCDELDALMDLTGDLQRTEAFGTDKFVALGRIRMAICDAQAVAERECKWRGGDSDEPADR
jgi:hypothetical protein